jgi:hypothetical protein
VYPYSLLPACISDSKQDKEEEEERKAKEAAEAAKEKAELVVVPVPVAADQNVAAVPAPVVNAPVSPAPTNGSDAGVHWIQVADVSPCPSPPPSQSQSDAAHPQEPPTWD